MCPRCKADLTLTLPTEVHNFANLWGAAGFDDAPVVDEMGWVYFLWGATNRKLIF